MLVISMPAVKHIFTKDKLKSDENRVLVQKPSFPKKIDDIKGYTNQIDNYLSDQFGFRKIFIRSSNKLRYQLFNEISSKQITVGNNGFIYFNSHIADNPNLLIKSVCNVQSLPKTFQQKTISLFKGLLNYSKRLDIISDIAIIHTKGKIYPENLPEPQKSWCTRNSPAWWESLFMNEKHYRIYYPLKKMLDLKSSVQVYLPKHFHWHGILPNIIAKDIMKSLWSIDSIQNIESEKVNVSTDLRTHTLGLKLYDSSVKYNFDEFNIVICEGKNCINGIQSVYKNNISYVYSNPLINSDTKLVVLADSFGQYIAKNFILGFPEVIVININNLSLDEQFKFYEWSVKEVKPTHLLHLMHDGGIYGRTIKLERLMKEIEKV